MGCLKTIIEGSGTLVITSPEDWRNIGGTIVYDYRELSRTGEQLCYNSLHLHVVLEGAAHEMYKPLAGQQRS